MLVRAVLQDKAFIRFILAYWVHVSGNYLFGRVIFTFKLLFNFFLGFRPPELLVLLHLNVLSVFEGGQFVGFVLLNKFEIVGLIEKIDVI